MSTIMFRVSKRDIRVSRSVSLKFSYVCKKTPLFFNFYSHLTLKHSNLKHALHLPSRNILTFVILLYIFRLCLIILQTLKLKDESLLCRILFNILLKKTINIDTTYAEQIYIFTCHPTP